MSRERKPNIVFVLTDDQGYPDLGCCGNPWLKTPCIDAFAGQAVRFQDFHVAPLCAPTRGALMTGLRPARNGVWATCWGRSILNPDNKILPELLLQAGYRTGMFGKWHLGDNVPNRPQDRGFESVVAHKGGGVGQTPDFGETIISTTPTFATVNQRPIKATVPMYGFPGRAVHPRASG